MVGYSLNKNPFQITTPEDLSAKEACDLFVNEFTDFSRIFLIYPTKNKIQAFNKKNTSKSFGHGQSSVSV